MKKAITYFGLVLGGALVSSAVGALFAVVIAQISPEFIDDLFAARDTPANYAAVVGMIGGLFIGAGVMCFCLGVTAFVELLRSKPKKDPKAAA